MKNTKIIKLLCIIIVLCIILLIVKMKTKPTKISNNNMNINNNNTIFNNYNQINSKNTTINSNQKTVAVFNNYAQIEKEKNSSKENVNKKQQSSPTLNNNNKVKNTIEQDSLKTVDIIEHQMKNRSISGIVKNNTDHTVKNLQIAADCYDKDNNKLSIATTYLSELEPGETWKFDMWTYSDTVKYKNIKVTYK